MATETRRRMRITVAAVALLAGVIAVPVANGAVSGDEGGAEAKGQGNHCTLDAKSGETQCFESLDKATGIPGSKRLLDASTGKAKAAGETRAGKEPVASSGVSTKDEGEESNIIGATVFEDTRYGGASLTITNTALCDGDADDVDFKIDLSDDWKDKISSIQPWGNCTLNLFSEPGEEGERDGPFAELTPNLGDVMDNRTKSISFS
ncbi:hypothetical protein DB35_12915 [Streptomyces abyssalis]|uniref:Uncharacterized protein n=1 Tax=Streptomyces abyssalis TaxID=933944 RepID=A0A1E7JGX4_9ACTN|nr:hypothetical protein [Streptomyces abyssalis]OEU85711.1 hypothetical protein AN215_25060 [Streptomyces abyssalis]OEU93295.1 hypothetical protein DB35_12890 [Streptomyces abyssalis]OEU93297.1 hypothetical protein DB35_12915 [Streptomyces abyssalis]OEV31269.1 hypothetical protein AN219_06025 [Streptomyces nanshensis]